MREIVKDTTSFIDYIVLIDSTTGLPKTGLAYTDITGSYVRTGGSRTAITMATLAAANSAYSSGGFKEVDATNQPGLYRVDWPDAALATGSDKVIFSLKAAGVRTEHKEYRLISWDRQIAILPNVASAGSGGLITRGTGTGQLNVADGRADADVLYYKGTTIAAPTVAGLPDVNVTKWNNLATVALPLTPTTAGRTLDVSDAGNAGIDWANIDAPTTAVNLSGTTISTSQAVASVSGSVGSVTGSVGSVAGNVGGNVSGSVGSISGITFPSNFSAFSIDATGKVLLQATQTGVTIPTVTTLTNDPTGVGTLLSRLTSGRAANLDNLDAAVSDTLTAFDFAGTYVAPNNSGITTAATQATNAAASAAAVDGRLPASPAAVGDAMTLTSGERNSIATSLLDLANGVETSVTVRKALRAIAAAVAGKVTGSNTDVETYFAIGNTGTPRVVSNADVDGNRDPTLTL